VRSGPGACPWVRHRTRGEAHHAPMHRAARLEQTLLSPSRRSTSRASRCPSTQDRRSPEASPCRPDTALAAFWPGSPHGRPPLYGDHRRACRVSVHVTTLRQETAGRVPGNGAPQIGRGASMVLRVARRRRFPMPGVPAESYCGADRHFQPHRCRSAKAAAAVVGTQVQCGEPVLGHGHRVARRLEKRVCRG
jgi:hypothetical protein